MTAAIAFEDVTLRYGGRDVLREFTLAVEPGEVVALLGPSGCGKTSALRLVLGFVAPSKGSIRLSGEVVSHDGKILCLPEQRGVGVVFQDLALWPHLTGSSCGCLITLGVSAQGGVTFLDRVDAASGTHCATADDAGHAWWCDQDRGSVWRVADSKPPSL